MTLSTELFLLAAMANPAGVLEIDGVKLIQVGNELIIMSNTTKPTLKPAGIPTLKLGKTSDKAVRPKGAFAHQAKQTSPRSRQNWRSR